MRTARRLCPTASRSLRADAHVGETQCTAECHVRVEATIAFNSSMLARSSAAERSGNAERERILEANIGGGELVEQPVEVALVQGDHVLGRGARPLRRTPRLLRRSSGVRVRGRRPRSHPRRSGPRRLNARRRRPRERQIGRLVSGSSDQRLQFRCSVAPHRQCAPSNWLYCSRIRSGAPHVSRRERITAKSPPVVVDKLVRVAPAIASISWALHRR